MIGEKKENENLAGRTEEWVAVEEVAEVHPEALDGEVDVSVGDAQPVRPVSLRLLTQLAGARRVHALCWQWWRLELRNDEWKGS